MDEPILANPGIQKVIVGLALLATLYVIIFTP